MALVILLLLAVTISAMAIPTCTACIADVVGAGSRASASPSCSSC
ncbi:hypothetical protein ACFQ0B_32205 [Nonomuraea thailandensis]